MKLKKKKKKLLKMANYNWCESHQNAISNSQQTTRLMAHIVDGIQNNNNNFSLCFSFSLSFTRNIHVFSSQQNRSHQAIVFACVCDFNKAHILYKLDDKYYVYVLALIPSRLCSYLYRRESEKCVFCVFVYVKTGTKSCIKFYINISLTLQAYHHHHQIMECLQVAWFIVF